MSRLPLLAMLGLLVVVAAVVAAPAGAAGDGPVATAAARCNLDGKGRKLGPTYVTSLSTTGTSCRTGERVVRAYYRCRVRNGGRRGRCHSRVLGYRCTETRTSISTEFDARVRCRNGSARVNHTYTQFT
jgi:hypothetical protein